MPNTVLLKRSSVAGKVPTTLEYGEVTINYTDGVLWYKTSANTITRINSAVSGGTVNGLAYLGSANVLVNSAGLTFNPTGNTLTVGGNIVTTANITAGNITTSGTSGNILNVDYIFSNNFVYSANGIGILSSVNANIGAYQTYGNAQLALRAPIANPSFTGVLTSAGNVVAASGTASAGTTTGALVVAGGAGISGNLNVGGNVTVTGHVSPSANVTYDLGSPTQRWKDLYLSGNTMVLGQANIQAHSSGITIYAPNQTVNLNQNLHTTATPSFANITATGNLIVNARLRDYTGNAGINGQLLASTGTGVQWVSRDTGSLASLSDVNLSDPYVQQVLTYDGTNWVNADSNAVVASAVFASSQSDLGSVTDLVLTITEDEGLVTDVATTIYDLGVLSFTGIISLNNIDQSIKSDYLGYSIIFGF